jgi:hypothetical protein
MGKHLPIKYRYREKSVAGEKKKAGRLPAHDRENHPAKKI